MKFPTVIRKRRSRVPSWVTDLDTAPLVDAGQRGRAAGADLAARSKVVGARVAGSDLGQRAQQTAGGLASSDAAQRGKELGAELGHRATEAAQDLAERTRELAPVYAAKAQEVAQDLAERTRELAPVYAAKAQDTAHDVADRTRELAPVYAAKAQDTAQDLADRARDLAPGVASRAQDAAQVVQARAAVAATVVADKAQEVAPGLVARAQDTGHDLADRGRTVLPVVAGRLPDVPDRDQWSEIALAVAGDDARNIAVGRVGMGAAMVLKPSVLTSLLGADPVAARRTRWVARLAGVRDMALGLGHLHASQNGLPVAPWVIAGASCDVADAVILVGAARRGDIRKSTGVLFALGAAACGAAAYRSVR